MAKKLRWLSLLCLLVISALIDAKPAQAASSLGFAISPPVTELAADPGQSVKGTIKIINLTDLPISLTVDRNNFVARGEEGEVDLIAEDTLYSLAPWFRGSTTVDVPARGTQPVDFSIAVPNNAEPGGRYGSLVFHTNVAKLPSGQSGAAVKQELAALIFLRISGAAHEQLKIDSFKTNKSFYQYGPIDFESRVHNLGNVHEKPTGTIEIKNMFGGKMATVSLDSKNVIPAAIRKMTASWPKKLLFGRYTATLRLKNGEKQALTATTTFIVIPYKLVAAVLVVLILLYFIFWRRRKRFGRAMRVIFGKD